MYDIFLYLVYLSRIARSILFYLRPRFPCVAIRQCSTKNFIFITKSVIGSRTFFCDHVALRSVNWLIRQRREGGGENGASLGSLVNET